MDTANFNCPHCGTNYIIRNGNQESNLPSWKKCKICQNLMKIDPPSNLAASQLSEENQTLIVGLDFTKKELLLRILSNSLTPSQEFRVNQPIMTVGRKSHNYQPDIEIETHDAKMSRLHMKIFYNEKGNFYSIQDIGSSNGTFLNEKEVKRHPVDPTKNDIKVIHNGDIIRLGKTKIEVVIKSEK